MDSESTNHLPATDVVISSADARTATATGEAALVNPSILSDAAASLNLGLGDSDKKKSSTNRLSGAKKIESVHESLDKMRCGVGLLDSVKNFLNETTTKENKSSNELLLRAIELSANIIEKEIGSISNSVNNTGEKTSSIQAHKKLTKNANRMAKHAKLEEERVMKKNPAGALRTAIKLAGDHAPKDTCSSGKRKSDQSTSSLTDASSLPPRQVRKTSDGNDSSQSQSDGKDKVLAPRVPRPLNGALVYQPFELKLALHHLETNIEQLSGTQNKNLQRKFRAQYKQELITKEYIPIRISALNNFAKNHVEGDKPVPLFWDQKGGCDYIPIDDLHGMLQQKGKRVGQGWSYDDTKNAVYDAKKARAAAGGKDIHQIAEPDKKTVDAYHSALKSMSNITERTAQSKTQHRDIAETSSRAMMSNYTGMLSVVAVIESAEHPIPAQFKFDASRASKGENLSREIYAKAMGVPVESVHFTPPDLISNIDDMASMYVPPKKQDERSEDRSVLVDVSSTTNNSYGIHSSNVNSEPRCNDLKIRLTNSITLGGQYMPVFVQLPGFTENEIPRSKVPNGVVILEVPGLALDGNINPFSNNVGYIALIRGNEKDCETEVFRHYEQKVRQPSLTRIRQNLNLPPSDPIAQAVITIDGGVPQLIAHMESSQQKKDRNETLVKFHKNTSAVAQSNDTGDGHMRIRHHMKKLSSLSVASITLLQEMNHLLSIAKNRGLLNISSEKTTNIINGICRVPTALRKSYTEESIRRASAKPGWLGESLQAPDVFQCFKQLKRSYTQEESKKWIDDAPTLVKMYMSNGCFDEDLATSLGYPEDTDSSGREHPQTASMVTQHHRQRLTIPTNPNLMQRLLSRIDAAADAREKERQARVDEMRWREGILKANAEAEKKLHIHSERPADSNRSLLQNDDTNDARRIAAIGGLSKTAAAAFVMARSMTSKSDKTFKKPANGGNATNLKATIAKLAANSDATLDKKEYTWVYQAWKKYKDPLLLQMLEVDDEEDETDPIQPTSSLVLPADIVVRTPSTPSIEQLTSSTIIESIDLVNQARDSLLGCVLVEDSHRLAQLPLRNLLIKQMIPRISSFRQSRQSYQYHWALDALADNIGRISDVLALARRIAANIETFSASECLLRAPGTGSYRKAFTNVDENVNNKALQGVALYLDKGRGSFRAATSASGTNEKTFEWKYDKDLKQSKNPESANALSKWYPFKTPSLRTEGGFYGTFEDLELCIGIGFDPTKDNACLTREEGGLFVWSEATLNRLKESKAADDLETKKRILVCGMFELFFHLMLDARIRSAIPLKAFSQFIVAPK